MAIVAHADVESMLIGMAARIASLRAVAYAAAVAADLAEIDPDHVVREGAASLLRWLLSIVKNSGAETAHDIQGKAILLFGGAGYSTDWPIERRLRHARILAIYEGTTGIQALDLVRRRWLAPDSGYEPFVALVEADLARPPAVRAAPLRHALGQLIATTQWLRDPAREESEIDAAAPALLRAATIVAHAWAAARLAGSDDPGLAACGRHGLSVMTEQLQAPSRRCRPAPPGLKPLQALRHSMLSATIPNGRRVDRSLRPTGSPTPHKESRT